MVLNFYLNPLGWLYYDFGVSIHRSYKVALTGCIVANSHIFLEFR